MNANYHTHTARCKHAWGSVEDYIFAAKNQGLLILGISDHTPLPDDRWINMRMGISELENYINEIEEGQKKFQDIKILKGMECDYSKEYHSFFKDELLGAYKFDYLLASVHFYMHKGQWKNAWNIDGAEDLVSYAESIIQAMETGLFKFIGHPDSFAASYRKWDHEAICCTRYIAEASKYLDIPLEINSYGFRKGMVTCDTGKRHQYPVENFWEIASEYDVKVIVNSDAHTPEDVTANINDALRIAQKYNLQIVDDI